MRINARNRLKMVTAWSAEYNRNQIAKMIKSDWTYIQRVYDQAESRFDDDREFEKFVGSKMEARFYDDAEFADRYLSDSDFKSVVNKLYMLQTSDMEVMNYLNNLRDGGMLD